ncbi:inhibitor of nuclear factor kappa-B kinase subunit alpha-like [Centruroides sculpturatus]|uniref:inhibitor of nuclear factor kappa-B kinase subunit alpha-like n=1 Tax=Centruroides sculpturatus TaxID=218467 RepID=UPI000C6EA5F9|nr:inhibitor of nuclear factor kappa-B kinase subunit alpha-like [Centruroides sculpturatus]XP_023233197.1 inhibitor of nuclear factor kappa-B kinase subunit alpha-like [Centruroides sculpturatus]XP_023233198.1 inhibitor of nuclear factor kappa-B kinase subunit alpha-like [Centruroides sculpturatus]
MEHNGGPVEVGTEIDGWIRGPILGHGGFGMVILWKKKDSTETIALKQCRWGHDAMMTPKHKHRWKLEVDIMKRLSHPNVVKALEVPPALDVPETELPLLAMEYCSGGDLRKVLSKSENCCGLNEREVKNLIKHIAAAIKYLHSQRIIHRDLKPENIVLQEMDNKIIYKLIDLGYAKELDQGSLCTSFVGTLQYLAPELFMQNKYSNTVDYWSFGLVAHEVITGQRPFLPHMNTPQWMQHVSNKTKNHIGAILDEEGKVMFVEELSPFVKITNIFKKDMEMWLKLMLDWNPFRRGREGDMTTYELLDQILNKKVIQVFCTESCRLFALEVEDNVSLEEIQVLFESETGIPKNEQEILLPNGSFPDPNKNAVQLWTNPEEGESIVFLSKKCNFNEFSGTKLCIPPLVARMTRSPRLTMDYELQKSAWTQALYLCHNERTVCQKLLQAYKINVEHIVSINSVTYKAMSKIAIEKNCLSAKVEFFKISLEKDLKKYEEQARNNGITSNKMHDKWKKSFDLIEKFENLLRKIAHLEINSANAKIKTVEFQKNPYNHLVLPKHLEDIYQKILDAYHRLKRKTQEQRNIPSDNVEMVQLVCSYIQQKDKVLGDIFSSLVNLKQMKKDIIELQPKLESLALEIQEFSKEVQTAQLMRQNDLWTILEYTIDKLKMTMPQSSSNQRVTERHSQTSLASFSQQNSFHPQAEPMTSANNSYMDQSYANYLMFGMHQHTIPNLWSLLSQCSTSSKDSLLSSLSMHSVRERSNQDSLRLLEESEDLRNKMDYLISNLSEKCKTLDNPSEGMEEELKCERQSRNEET